ncbi:MAG TPA: DNA replication and repair protein RecF [Pyrinomonadaceae bacterium]|nr:DNA replication and repair protein RecF [Pyrinomonadaceae bacterium]
MLLTEIDIKDFRNLGGKISCGKDKNILLGENGQGKTNLLEAIYTLTTGRSFRTTKINEAVAFGAGSAAISGEIIRANGLRRSLQIIIEGKSRNFYINGKRESANRYIESAHSFVFNTETLEIIRGGPENRRDFLDRSICSIYPAFTKTLADYARVIKQKNALLTKAQEDGRPGVKLGDEIAPWNGQLIGLAEKIHRARTRFVMRMNENLPRGIFDGERLEIRYVSALEGKGDLNEYARLIKERLELRLDAEISAGHSLIGPHRDELEINYDGHLLKKYGSAGQQRSAALAMLLSNIELFRQQMDEYPILLLDDLDAELDYRRISQLLEYLEGKLQVFISTSKPTFAERFKQGADLFEIDKGRAKRRDPESRTAAADHPGK